ncbi:MAG TPA: Omp28-related outer membrane protein [Edaphocola sp.]|nr:Omp28-related outer membrane protein [Edaphocola sp.]
MLKGIYPVLIAGLLLSLGSCKEQPVILSHAAQGTDSTYVGAAETPQAKTVLATELTGVTCPNCPEGAEMLETLNQQHGGNLIVVSIHSGVLTTPINNSEARSQYDFRSDDGDAILNQVLGGDPGIKPVVAFNRLPIGTDPNSNKYFIDSYSQNWGPKLGDAFAEEAPVKVNVTVSAQYNSSTGKYDIRAKVAYNQAVPGKQRLNLYLTQDSIIDVQQTSDPSHHYDENYVFMNVFRKAITGISGQPILDSLATKEAGRVYIFNTSVALAPPPHQDWVARNMHVVAFVSEEAADDIHVFQSAKTALE